MTEARAWQALALLTAMLYAGLVWLLLTELLPEAGGLAPFDSRLTGYSVAEGQTYLAALSADGREIYLGSVGTLDTVFPLCLGALLAWPLVRRTAGAWRALALLPLAYVAADLAENARVAGLLRGDLPGDPATIEAASLMTQAKFASLAAAAIALALVFVRTRGR